MRLFLTAMAQSAGGTRATRAGGGHVQQQPPGRSMLLRFSVSLRVRTWHPASAVTGVGQKAGCVGLEGAGQMPGGALLTTCNSMRRQSGAAPRWRR